MNNSKVKRIWISNLCLSECGECRHNVDIVTDTTTLYNISMYGDEILQLCADSPNVEFISHKHIYMNNKEQKVYPANISHFDYLKLPDNVKLCGVKLSDIDKVYIDVDNSLEYELNIYIYTFTNVIHVKHVDKYEFDKIINKYNIDILYYSNEEQFEWSTLAEYEYIKASEDLIYS